MRIFLLLLCFSMLQFAQAQTETYTINWGFGSNPNAAGNENSSLTIEVGDTVTWFWHSNGFHNVVSQSSATENFNSGTPQGNGFSFSHTFTQEGTNDYVCQPHAGSMFGTITVVPDGTLNQDTFKLTANNLKVYPNPASSELSIEIEERLKEEVQLIIYNNLGQEIKSFKFQTPSHKIDVSSLKAGAYFIKLQTESQELTKSFIKL